jgi:hypothetical protein
MNKVFLPIALISAVLTVSACAPANVSTNLRQPSGNESSMATRCVYFTTGDEEDSNKTLKKFDGWKVTYTSEYTTGHKATTAMVMCFEKPYKE